MPRTTGRAAAVLPSGSSLTLEDTSRRLSNPGRLWKLQSLAREAGVSLGQSFNVKKLLLDREWIETGDEGLRLTAPAKLLVEWEDNYDFRRNMVRQFYTLKQIADFERRLAETCAKEHVAFALAGFSSATRYAAMVRYQRAMAYISGDVDELAARRSVLLPMALALPGALSDPPGCLILDALAAFRLQSTQQGQLSGNNCAAGFVVLAYQLEGFAAIGAPYYFSEIAMHGRESRTRFNSPETRHPAPDRGRGTLTARR